MIAADGVSPTGVLESITDGLLVLDAEWCIVYLNAAAERMSGMGRGDMLGKNYWELFPAAVGTVLHRELLRASIQRISVGFEHHDETSKRWFRVKAYPTPEGGILVLYEDIAPFHPSEPKILEQALRETEERFRAIVEASPECVKIVARDGKLLQMNPSGLAMIGAESIEAVIGRSVYDLIAPEHRESYRAFNERVCSGEKGSLEFDLVGLQGLRRNMESFAVPFRHRHGKIAQLALTRDVTDRKNAERASLLLSAIVDSSDDAIVSKDLNGIITSWNKGAERVFGYTADEVVGKSITIIIPPDRLDEEPDILDRLKRGQRVDHFETIRRRKDGLLLNISLTISPVKDSKGRIIGASKIARDITDRKRVEAALQESEAKFRQLADSMPQMVWTARPDGSVDYYNQRWYDFTGTNPDTFAGRSWESLLHPEDAERCLTLWSECVTTGESYSVEYRFWDSREKRWRWFMGRALPVRNSTGAIVKWFGTCTDIDEQKRVEDELRHANQDLEQFAYSASHDLQEPLRTVKIYSELLTARYRHKLDAEGLEFFDHLRKGATRMEILVRDLLAYTQVTKADLQVETVEASVVLSETLEGLARITEENGAVITSDSLPRISMNNAHLQQLFQNLISNAIKYQNPGCIPMVHIGAEPKGEMWKFYVRDNGIGIDPEYKEQIFGLFKRLHRGNEYSGTGIGLAICQRIVERYDGRIWVESEPGRGSTFFFTVPK